MAIRAGWESALHNFARRLSLTLNSSALLVVMVKILIAKLRLISFHPILLSSHFHKSLILSPKKKPGRLSRLQQNA
jgi:hypothetical protein